MPKSHQQLTVRVWDGYGKAALEADLTGRWTRLIFSTALHGGFKECRVDVPMALGETWLWLNRENLPGRHFHHLEVAEGERLVWEGRVMDVEYRSDAAFEGIALTAYGYWSSMRDRYYDADDAGNTDWATGGPHVVSSIIKEMVTNECPDINGTAGIEANTRNIAGIDLTARAYPQDIIVDKLAPLSDSDASVWHFAVWDGRKPYWKKRQVTQVDWYVWRRDLGRLSLRQQGKHLRNYVLPVTGTAEGTGTADAESQTDYPVREMMLELPSGVSGTAANDARDAALAERKFPSQDSGFTVTGRVYSTKAAGRDYPDMDAVSGALVERPKWWARAGDVMRLQDLVPASAATPELDALRTFHLVETSYDAVADVLEVQPDRPAGRLGVLLARISQLERNK